MTTRKQLERRIDNLAGIFLVLAGAAGLFVELMHVFGLEEFVVYSHDGAVLLALLGLVAVALGLERLLRFRAIEDSVDNLSSLLSGLSGCRLITGKDEIYASATLPVSRAQRQIRSLVALDPAKAPINFAQAVARRLSESLASGKPIRFQVVFAARLDNLPADFLPRLKERTQVYEQAGIGHLVSRSIVDTDPRSIFDMLIVDEFFGVISFPTISASISPQVSIVFEDPRIVRELADWFDQRVLGQVKPLPSHD
jgi:hypothetical protein